MKYDTIIVGAGSAGSVLACRLTQQESRSVLLLESGPDYPDIEQIPDHIKYGVLPWYESEDHLSHTWGYEAKATHQNERTFSLPRGKVTGGSSAINGQVWLRGIPEDFDEWEKFGNKGWSYLEVLPFFRKSETDHDFAGDDFHGSSGLIPVKRYEEADLHPGPKAFLAACVAAGYPIIEDMNHPDSTGVGFYPLNRIDGIRMSTALTYLNAARNRLNFTLKSDVHVRKVLIKNGRAFGVEVISGGEVFQAFSNQVILSAGAINSPQLLMLSGVGPEKHLSTLGINTAVDLPGVGQNLRDHPAVFMLYRSSAPEYNDGSPELVPPTQIGMRYTTPGSRFRNDMQMRPITTRTEHVPAEFSFGKKSVPIGFNIALQKALSKGELRLATSDPMRQPILDYRYLAHEFDRERMRGAVRLCAEISEMPEYIPAQISRIMPTDEILSSDYELDEWLFENVSTAEHSSGTCKMGPQSDTMAVVNQNCEVHGVENLMVVDASIMPDVVSSNTNATTIMIAEKIADYLDGS